MLYVVLAIKVPGQSSVVFVASGPRTAPPNKRSSTSDPECGRFRVPRHQAADLASYNIQRPQVLT